MSEVRETVDDSNAGVVHTIVLWRIYDVLLLLLKEVNPESAGKVATMHEAGHFVGPNPSWNPYEMETESD